MLSRKAQDLKQIAAAARCEELIGRSRGMFIEKVEARHSIKTIDDIPEYVLDQLIREAEAVIKELPPEEQPKLLVAPADPNDVIPIGHAGYRPPPWGRGRP